jgi:hypothetical protein
MTNGRTEKSIAKEGKNNTISVQQQNQVKQKKEYRKKIRKDFVPTNTGKI